MVERLHGMQKVAGSIPVVSTNPNTVRNRDRLNAVCYYADFIGIYLTPFKINPAKIVDLYLKEGLSASQVAEKLDIGKTAVLNRLHALGIRRKAKKQHLTNPENYRSRCVPYGFRKVDGRLAPCRKEMKICRLIVKYAGKEKLSFRSVAKKLEEQGVKNRVGGVWHHYTVGQVYKRWKDKI